MCLIVFAWRPGHAQPLIVAANRDEFYARPTQPLARWDDFAQIVAGRDLEAGGTWLGLGPAGRFAALTNIRQPGQPAALRSRGELVAGFVQGTQTTDEYLTEVARLGGEYAGFNLLLGDGRRLVYCSSSAAARTLPQGVYGLSNAGLDTPWPKLVKARQALADQLEDYSVKSLMTLLADPAPAIDGELPETGVGLATERLLSSVFIASPHYGTRASTVVIQTQEETRIVERSFGPYGARLSEVAMAVPLADSPTPP
ncbi:NRDE family protein [Pseudomonas sp. dw_358]|uniref:NRDE family protein n=1 Tax=Pseudomonas sp. dw_358 TaxID=2720083 RepID=UPI001BD4B1D9|nr:NRDE family protein [Pseudomonas sp. dw_358]